MHLKQITAFLIIISMHQITFCQTETYTITPTPFTSDKYDEFGPVYYKNGIVFCTNRNRGLTTYSTDQGQGLFKITFIDTVGKANWQNTRLFSKNLTTNLNDGTVTFNSTGDTIYYSRNLEVNSKLRDISSLRNKMGIFSAVFDGKEWTKIRGLRINNEWYNVITPCLTSNGKRLYFASDKPGGLGGFDLYFCSWRDGYWDDPVNLGPVINTKGNEGYPFINPAGDLFFASDGHPGLGGKDIFFSRFSGNDWLPPVRLDAPVNSKYDDFGIVTDTLSSEGYFSSARNKSIDIFHFKTNFPQIFYTNVQKENQYCFMFSDSGEIAVDTLILKYVWDFGDGNKADGALVKHCFHGPGNYNVRLNLFDRTTGNHFFSKLDFDLVLSDFEQPYINSKDVSLVGETIKFDGLKSYIPGYNVLNYIWDFGDGTRMVGESVTHNFEKIGDYFIKMGVKLQSITTGHIHYTGVSKKITILETIPERDSYISFVSERACSDTLKDIRQVENAHITIRYSAEIEFMKEALFRIELRSSKTRIGTGSSVFRNVQGKYFIKEVSDSVNGLYYYIADEQINLMDTYPAFRDLTGLGFSDIRLRMVKMTDPAERELVILKKSYGVLTDMYFDVNNRLTGNGYLMLDQIVNLMNRNPAIRLAIGIHTDNQGVPANNLALSNIRAQVIVKYLISRGINGSRLIAKGYGGIRPVASNTNTANRRLNRRIEFTIINEYK